MNAAPDRPEAALQFTLRKSIRKTVTTGKDFAPPADSRRLLSDYPRSRKSVVHAPGWRHPAGLEAMVKEHRPAKRPCQARKIALLFKTQHCSPAIPPNRALPTSYTAGSFTLAQMSYYVRSFLAFRTIRSQTAEAK
jgi:hypothetical protein